MLSTENERHPAVQRSPLSHQPASVFQEQPDHVITAVFKLEANFRHQPIRRNSEERDHEVGNPWPINDTWASPTDRDIAMGGRKSVQQSFDLEFVIGIWILSARDVFRSVESGYPPTPRKRLRSMKRAGERDLLPQQSSTGFCTLLR